MQIYQWTIWCTEMCRFGTTQNRWAVIRSHFQQWQTTRCISVSCFSRSLQSIVKIEINYRSRHLSTVGWIVLRVVLIRRIFNYDYRESTLALILIWMCYQLLAVVWPLLVECSIVESSHSSASFYATLNSWNCEFAAHTRIEEHTYDIIIVENSN